MLKLKRGHEMPKYSKNELDLITKYLGDINKLKTYHIINQYNNLKRKKEILGTKYAANNLRLTKLEIEKRIKFITELMNLQEKVLLNRKNKEGKNGTKRSNQYLS